MSREKEITDFITDLASHLKAKVGHKPDSVVGVPDVSETMHVDDRTVRNYAGGLTTGSMTIESFARFGAEFRGELPDLTDRAIDLLCKVFGGHFQRDGVEDKTFLPHAPGVPGRRRGGAKEGKDDGHERHHRKTHRD
jgi:hypothetical protein